MSDPIVLLSPRFLSLKNRLRQRDRRETIRSAAFFTFGSIFWLGTFFIFYRVLVYFQGIEGFGHILAAKLLSMVFLTFFSLLIFSNIITSLSTYFLSEDLNLLLALPVSVKRIYLAKFVETMIDSSWMLLMFGTPVFLVYGIVYSSSIGYFLLVALIILPFLMIPAAIGIFAVMVLVNLFPARRTRDILILLSVFFFIGLYFLVRFLQPEKLVDPEAFSGLIAYFTALNTPSLPFSPSYWATETLLPLLLGFEGDPIFFTLMLWSTALAFLVLGAWAADRLYLRGWSKSQEGKKARISKSEIVNRLIGFGVRPFSAHFRNMVMKDLKTFFRDSTQWSQLFLLGALIVVYLYNFSVIPMEKMPIPTFYLQNLISFLNMALAGFVLSAIAVRFIFPSVSLEGRSFWILRSSPLSMKKFIWSKFWMGFSFLVVVSEILIIMTNRLLHVTTFMMILSTVTMFFMTFGITALGVGMGAVYPRFRFENVAKIASGFGGIMYMILTMSFIGLTVAFEAFPVYTYFMSRLKGYPINLSEWILFVLCFLMALLVNVLAFIVPMRIGLRRLEQMEL